MAKLKHGFDPGLSGSLGQVVFCKWKDTVYVRRRPTYNRDNRSPKQLAQQEKYAVAAPFLQSIKELAKQSFFDPRSNVHPSNSARSLTVRNAIAGEYPNLYLVHEMLYLAYGNLPGPENPEVYAGEEAAHFTWQNQSLPGIAKANDAAILVAFNPETNACYYSIGGVTRSMEKGTLSIPVQGGQELHTWLAFVNASRTDASRSVYTGKIMM